MKQKLKWLTERILVKSRLGGRLSQTLSKIVKIKKTEYLENDRAALQELYPKREITCLREEKTIDAKYHLQIVVPVYNAKAYIKDCLTSVLSQNTQYRYKVVLVNDGSSDGSEDILKEYETDARVQVLHQKNGGAAAARNRGLEKLSADYLMFLDIDDKLKSDAIETLLRLAYEKQAQIVEGGYEIFDKQTEKVICHKQEQVKAACGTLWGFPWGKVMATELFQNICFPEGYWYEDTIISYLVYTRSRVTYTTDAVVYCYRKNANGFSHIKGNQAKLLDSYWIYEIMLADMKKLELGYTQELYEQFLESIRICGKRIMYMDQPIQRAVLSGCARILNQEFADFSTNREHLKFFEKVVRNNQYSVYRWLIVML